MGASYSREKKEINTALKPMRAYPSNSAMQGHGCKQLLAIVHKYEAPHVVVRLMGSKTCKVVCTCIKLHHHSGIVMRSATHLLMELCKNEKNLKRVKKLKIMHKLAETKKEFFMDEHIVRCCEGVEAAMRGVYQPTQTMQAAIDTGDAELVLLIMKFHPGNRVVQHDGLQAILQISRDTPSSRVILVKNRAVGLVTAAMNALPTDNAVQALGASVFAQISDHDELNRSVGRDGGVAALVQIVRKHDLWKETHQQALWALGKLVRIETNCIHMKREKLYIVLRELLVRKEAVYMNVEKEHVKKEDESITREIKMRGKRDHRAEDEWEEMNPHVRWDFIEEAVARERKIVKEPTPFERYQQNAQGPQEEKLKAGEYKSRAQQEKERAHKKRLAELMRGSAATRNKKKKEAAEAIAMEFEGIGQSAALFVPKQLRRIDWSKYDETAVIQYEKLPDATKDKERKPVPKKRTYKETMELLLGPKEQRNTRKPPRGSGARIVPEYLTRLDGYM